MLPAAPLGTQSSEVSLPSKHVFLGVEVSATGLDEEECERIALLVNAGGGNFSRSFSPATHVLVARRVGSDKHRAALEWGIPVVTPKWVTESVNADVLLNKNGFLVRPFDGLKICITGFQTDPSVRAGLIEQIEGNGGRYYGVMQQNFRTHLVVEKPLGEKYQAAMAWNEQASSGEEACLLVHIVNKNWIEDCVAAGRWIPEDKYTIHTKSNVDGVKKTIANQTEEDQEEKARELEEVRKQEEEKAIQEQKLLEKQMAEELDMYNQLKTSGKCLDILQKYNIYLHGFDVKRWRVALFLSQCTGATVLWEWTQLVTHVLVGHKPNQEYLKELKHSNPDVQMIEMDVVLNCLRSEQPPKRKRRIHPLQLGEERQQDTPPAKKAAISRKDTQNVNLQGFLSNLGKENLHDRNGRSLHNTMGTARLNLAVPFMDFRDALICVSRYTSKDRARVEQLARKLGAKYTDRLTRKNPRVTHLISKDNEGEKCLKARQWKIPIHTIEWLEHQVSLHQKHHQK